MQALVLAWHWGIKVLYCWYLVLFGKMSEMSQARLKTCKACDFIKETRFGQVCSNCGCPIKAKVQDCGDFCPIGKW
jgi:hypothetical protein